MYELKTKETDRSVIEFIECIENIKKREDAYQLLDIFTKRQVTKRKCGDQALSASEAITINTTQVMRGMRRL